MSASNDMSTVTTATSSVPRASTRQVVNRPQLQQFFRWHRLSNGTGANECNSWLITLYGDRPELAHFFVSVRHRVEMAEAQQRHIDKRRATGFNVFHPIEPDENKLSDILADPLDPKGDHGQGDLFLRLLFKELGLGSDAKLTKNATVLREAPTHGILKYRRRMDVFVEARAWLVIENKLDSLEQRDQVKDYLEHLQQCCPRPPDQIDLPHARRQTARIPSLVGNRARTSDRQTALLEHIKVTCVLGWKVVAETVRHKRFAISCRTSSPISNLR